MAKNHVPGQRSETRGLSPLVPAFDRHFRKHVLPNLEAAAERLAPFVAQQLISYAEALDTLCWLANKRGSSWLADVYSLETHLAQRLAHLAEDINP